MDEIKNQTLDNVKQTSIQMLDADLMHENLCKCFVEFFDTYLKGIKDKPDLQTNDVMTITEYSPDAD